MRKNAAMLFVCAGAGFAAAPASAEPATADPRYAFDSAADHQGTAATLRRFQMAGMSLSVNAAGRRALADTQARRDAIEFAREMKEVMPGYPQPAYVTFDVRLSF